MRRYVVLSQPGADGYKKTTQKRVYNAGEVIFEGVTAGSTITFTPDQKYACGPVSKDISNLQGGSQSITLTAEALEGVISSNITLRYENRTMNLTFTTMSNLKVKKEGGTVIPHHRTSGNILVLDDLTELSAGDTLTISGQYGAGDFPIAVFEKTVTLRYWQASGESIKTSVRTKTRLEQLTERGFYTGGSIAYGYRLDKRGRTNKRNKEVFDLAVDEDAAKIIQLIFHKYVNEGYGAQRLSRYLEEKKIRKPNGKNFPNTSINRIIKNPIYTGVIRNGEAQSAFMPELQIIDQETFDRAQKIMSDRTTHHAETPLNLKGQSLLVGNIFCGHCKNRLTLTTGGRNRVRKDGSIYHDVRARYQCHYNVRHPGECDGQSGYGVKKLDGIIDRIVRYQFSKISAVSGEDIVAKQNQKAIELAKARHHLATMQLAEKQRELVDYQNEGIKVIRGQSKFDMEFLNELVSKAKAEVTELEAAVDAAKEELDIHLANDDIERKEYEKIKTWADLYDNCNFAAKKMIISQFIKSVYVYRDYTLEIEFNVSFEEFRTMATECQDQGTNEQPLVYITA